MNQSRQRGPIARIFVGIWDAVNFTRRLILNILFFVILFLIVAIIAASTQGRQLAPLHDRTTLVIAPNGPIVEQYTVDPSTRALNEALGGRASTEIQLRDLLRALEAAADDDRIERVYLQLDNLQASGFATIREVAAALARVRESGKQIVAYGTGYGQVAYLLAAQADEVYTDPMAGSVALTGLSSYGLYFGEALQQKLNIDIHVFKVGEYKSAVEPIILNAASPESKEADLYWLTDVWQRHLADIAQARGLGVEQIEAGIDGMADGVAARGGDLAQYALDQGLVDVLATEREVERLLVDRGVADEDGYGGFRSIGLQGYLAHVDRGLPKAVSRRPQVAVVVAQGNILDGEQSPGNVGGESTSALLREALEDDQVKAVVLRVNSPGGSAYASEQIGREILALQEAGKPVVASMGHLAASGGYWISMNADRIYANPSTITGSIGVFGLVPNFTRTLDGIGVNNDGVGTTRLAGAFDTTRPLEPDASRIIQAGVEKIYTDFITKVAEGRDTTPDAIDEIARGRVWTGAQARDRGLVDELGSLQDAIAYAARSVELGEGEYRVRYVEQTLSPFASFLSGMSGSRVGAWMLRDTGIAGALLGRHAAELDRHLTVFEQALGDGRGGPIKTLAYCFCPEL